MTVQTGEQVGFLDIFFFFGSADGVLLFFLFRD